MIKLEHKCEGCVACPMEVRDLYAVAYNFINQFDSDTGSAALDCRTLRKLNSLRNSVDRMGVIVKKHFGDGQ